MLVTIAQRFEWPLKALEMRSIKAVGLQSTVEDCAFIKSLRVADLIPVSPYPVPT